MAKLMSQQAIVEDYMRSKGVPLTAEQIAVGISKDPGKYDYKVTVYGAGLFKGNKVRRVYKVMKALGNMSLKKGNVERIGKKWQLVDVPKKVEKEKHTVDIDVFENAQRHLESAGRSIALMGRRFRAIEAKVADLEKVNSALTFLADALAKRG